MKSFAPMLALSLSAAVSAGEPRPIAGPPPAPAEWKTHAEATDYRETGGYEETLEWLRKAEAANPRRIKIGSIGESEEGRSIPLVILDRDSKFTPKAIRQAGRPIVLIQSAIHAGEIDGKDASLALVRELAVTHSLSGLLDGASIVMLPIYNPDGFARRGPFNRINQNGPKETGFRTNAKGLDLNRDYMKLDSKEARAFVKFVNEWRPDFFVDCHVTDGADYRYDVTWATQPAGSIPLVLSRMVESVMPRVLAGLEQRGHLVAPYIQLRSEAEPEKGMDSPALPPRFGTAYMPLRNIPSVLIETHMYKDYATRVRATYDFLALLVAGVGQQKKTAMSVVGMASREREALGSNWNPRTTSGKAALAFESGPESKTFLFRTWKSSLVRSSGTEGKFVVYSRDPKDVAIPLFDRPQPTAEVVRPTGYLIPPAWSSLADRLRLHGVLVKNLDEAVTAEFESYRIEAVKFAGIPYQGRVRVEPTVTPVVESRTFPKGSFYVPTAQADADVAIALLEPQGPDSFLQWGEMSSIFERKEWYEPAVIERMIAASEHDEPELYATLLSKKESDPALAADPEALREWYYRKTPYWAAQQVGVYPIARVTTQKVPGTTPAAP